MVFGTASRPLAADFMCSFHSVARPVLVLVLAWWLITALWVVGWVGSSIHARAQRPHHQLRQQQRRELMDLLRTSVLAWTLCDRGMTGPPLYGDCTLLVCWEISWMGGPAVFGCCVLFRRRGDRTRGGRRRGRG